jgi:F-box-like
MSLVTYNPANQLDEDVLLVIFDQLDGQDLIHCETVCHQWRNIILSGRPWKGLFRWKMVSSQQWREVWWHFGIDEKKLETAHYRELCKTIIKEVNETDNNWRTGNFKKTEETCYSINFAHVVIGKDWIANYDYNYRFRDDEKMITFRNRTSVDQHCVVIPDGFFAVTNAEIVVRWNDKNMEILDINGQLISEVPELDEDERISCKLASCCISDDRMAVISQNKGQEKLSLWDVSIPMKVTRLNSQYFNLDLFFESSHTYGEQLDRDTSMQMDEKFIAICTFRNESTKFRFFSKKTLELLWQKTLKGNMKNNFVYGQGMLLLYVTQSDSDESGLIEMYDITSGRFIRDICVSVKKSNDDLKYRVGLNSKFMIIAERSEEKGNVFNIYNLEAVKNKNSADDILVCVIEGCPYFCLLDESKIFSGIYTYNFGSFGLFENTTKRVTLSLPWRSVWRSKGVDEEPLQPVGHMEVYREVLKYFYELMNCHPTASKTFYVPNVDLATFTFGDDFIGFRKHPKIFIYDENMDESWQETNYKFVQISKTTHLSVMGKRIKLIDIETSNVVQERKLKREADDWHFNYNLLVVVCKIAEHEHLLSVWKIKNSVNLTHIKDVTTDDYDGAIQVDEMFIAINTARRENAEMKTYKFISMKTFQEERSLSPRTKYFEYDKGYLFLQNKNSIRILDVSSGTFLRDIRMEPGQPDSIICCANSNYVAVVSCNKFNSKLNVYDLKCLKETETVPSHLLLTSFDLESWLYGFIEKMVMNEHRIVCLSSTRMNVVDLKPIDCLRCPNLVDCQKADVSL